jgi:hypothetical protein
VTLVSLALPVANQADHIERVVDGHLAAVAELPCQVEFILAVNNSTDDSLGACRSLAERHPSEVTVVTTPPGWGNAVRGGLAIARGDVIGFTNSARTQTQDVVRAIDHALIDTNSLVKGWRAFRTYPLSRLVGSRLFNIECRLLFGLHSLDVNGNPKLWSRRVLPPDLLTEPGSFLDAEILILARRRRVPVLEFPVTCTDRHGGTSMTGLRLAMALYTRPVTARLGRRARRDAPPRTGYDESVDRLSSRAPD